MVSNRLHGPLRWRLYLAIITVGVFAHAIIVLVCHAVIGYNTVTRHDFKTFLHFLCAAVIAMARPGSRPTTTVLERSKTDDANTLS